MCITFLVDIELVSSRDDYFDTMYARSGLGEGDVPLEDLLRFIRKCEADFSEPCDFVDPVQQDFSRIKAALLDGRRLGVEMVSVERLEPICI